MELVTLEDIKRNSQVKVYIRKANEHLDCMGFTEHGLRHGGLVSEVARNILNDLNYPERICELAAIAGYLHDIGNVVARADHWQSSAVLCSQILTQMDMDLNEIATIMGAVGNHDERTGEPVSEVAAALIIADKGDVHKTRVRNNDFATFDIHDRVNYAVQQSRVLVDSSDRTISLNLQIDTKICPIMEYFEIFLTRMLMSRRAAEVLKCEFRLNINDTNIL